MTGEFQQTQSILTGRKSCTRVRILTQYHRYRRGSIWHAIQDVRNEPYNSGLAQDLLIPEAPCQTTIPPYQMVPLLLPLSNVLAQQSLLFHTSPPLLIQQVVGKRGAVKKVDREKHPHQVPAWCNAFRWLTLPPCYQIFSQTLWHAYSVHFKYTTTSGKISNVLFILKCWSFIEGRSLLRSNKPVTSMRVVQVFIPLVRAADSTHL